MLKLLYYTQVLYICAKCLYCTLTCRSHRLVSIIWLTSSCKVDEIETFTETQRHFFSENPLLVSNNKINTVLVWREREILCLEISLVYYRSFVVHYFHLSQSTPVEIQLKCFLNPVRVLIYNPGFCSLDWWEKVC